MLLQDWRAKSGRGFEGFRGRGGSELGCGWWLPGRCINVKLRTRLFQQEWTRLRTMMGWERGSESWNTLNFFFLLKILKKKKSFWLSKRNLLNRKAQFNEVLQDFSIMVMQHQYLDFEGDESKSFHRQKYLIRLDEKSSKIGACSALKQWSGARVSGVGAMDRWTNRTGESVDRIEWHTARERESQ